MSERKLPKSIHPSRLVQQNEALMGFLLTDNMCRLKEAVVSLDEKVLIDISFKKDEAGDSIAKGCFNLTVVSTCQRCLEPFELNIGSNINWIFVKNEEEAKFKDSIYDAIIVSHDELDFIEQIEDEILLNLPMITTHQNVEDCKQDFIVKTRENLKVNKSNPFDKLKSLKIKNSDSNSK